MGRITLLIATLAVAGTAGCKRDRSGTPEAAPKTIESVAAAEDEAEAALEVAREAKATLVPRALDEVDRISVAGRITESGADRLVVAPVVGEPVALRVDADTRVELDGQTRSAADLAPGTEVRLLYRLDGAQVVAERVDGHR